MQVTRNRVLAVLVLLAPIAVGSCATQYELEQLRGELNDVKAEARAARAEAAAATARADASTKAAADVSRKAERMYNDSLRK
jgi:Tfp pilus assembly protein FimT